MLNRRHFLISSLATGTVGISPALAHRKGARYRLPEKFMPREVVMKRRFPAGEVHVFPDDFYLYWTMGGGKAMRWSVGVGRRGLYHPGTYYVGRKVKWPKWTPTAAMIKRSPKYRKYKDGVPGGIKNPLGARALYLYTRKRGDSLLRIHGTNNPRTIGLEVSNGCARLVNDQVKVLYDMVPKGSKVVLHPKSNAGPIHS